ncbi:hypothetical protein INT43_004531 [Umbelopsis isabellina]|uniref:Uncharacterized protein n=1 Tax=Mortierella isabellina TaxID=91625 RepID=A0A8H7PFZ6_MORIS|nr:hypothetical protein INT43_004531 [Umbelopsis isabellina]
MTDLLHYRSHHIDADVWKQLMVAALTGNTEFRGEPLDRKVQLVGDKCKMSWISRLEGSIDLQIAELSLDRTVKKEISDRWKELLDSLFEDDKQLRDTRDAMLARIKGLEEHCEKLKIEAERVVRDKLDAELLLMNKFKLVLNAKKRKIKNLTTAMANADLLGPSVPGSAEPQATPTQSTGTTKETNKRTPSQKSRGKRKRSASPNTTPSSLASPSMRPFKGKQPVRARSLSRTPSLEELMGRSLRTANKEPTNITDESSIATASAPTMDKQQQQMTSSSIPAIKHEVPSLGAIMNTMGDLDLKNDAANSLPSILDDDDLYLRPRTVRTPRKRRS